MKSIDDIRAALAAAQSKVNALESAALPVPLVDALERLDTHIAKFAAEGDQHLTMMARHLAQRTQQPVNWFSPHQSYLPSALHSIECVLSAINAGDYRKALVERLEAFYAQPENKPMPESDRVKQLAAARAEVEKLEAAEYQYCITHGLPLKAGTRADLLLGL